jgi:hypothetical protein
VALYEEEKIDRVDIFSLLEIEIRASGHGEHDG